MAQCFSCRSEIYGNGGKEIHGMTLCAECIDRMYEQCEICGDYFDSSEMFDEGLCEWCADIVTETCEVCGKNVVARDYDYGFERCESCLNNSEPTDIP